MLPLRPILSTLRRHKTSAALIVLEIALTCAIVCNAVFLIAGRIDRLHFVSGIAEGELVLVGANGIGKPANPAATTRADVAALRALPGVRSVSVIDQVPFGDSENNSGISLAPHQANPTLVASTISADEAALGTLGLRLVAGRNFLPEEIQDASNDDADLRMPTAIVTQATADALFPDGHALGKSFYISDNEPTRIVGIVERLARPHPRFDASDGLAVIVPERLTFRDGIYVMRVDPARRDDVLKAAGEALARQDPHRVSDHNTRFDTLRADYFRADASMIRLLAGVCVALLVVTAFGIVGLASFWVQQRTRMIGTRRALGATRGQVRAYFQVENLLLTSTGIVLGMAGAYGVNRWLMTQYELPRLPLAYLPLGAIVLWALGQVAVLAPARRASEVPPALAMRGLVN
jgi:putative ABC transport system permease protein